jgi:hypothetical protein
VPELKKLFLVRCDRDPNAIKNLLLKHRTFFAFVPAQQSAIAAELAEARIAVSAVPTSAEALVAAIHASNHAWILEPVGADRDMAQAVKTIAAAKGLPVMDI